MNIKQHYDSLWKESLERYKRNEFEFDCLVDSSTDDRYGITLVARPSTDVKQTITDTLQQIKAVAPGQYYYPVSDLHVTVLTIISCYSGFSISQIDPRQYIELIQSATRSIAPFNIQFKGLNASPSCILIQGFPDEQLNRLRSDLREKFKQSNLQHSIDQRYIRQTAHITAIRYKQPFQDENGNNFIKKIEGIREKSFGGCLIDRLELVGTDWYHQKDKVQSIFTFDLKK